LANVAKNKLINLARERSRAADTGRLDEVTRFDAEIAATKTERDGAIDEAAMIQKRIDALQIRSPVDGVVATFQVKQNLLDRPVRRGDRLIEITKADGPWQYEGTFTGSGKGKSGTVHFKWSRVERRFNGTWRKDVDSFSSITSIPSVRGTRETADDRSGTISLRLVDNVIRGGWTTDEDAQLESGTPLLGDLLWKRRVITVPDGGNVLLGGPKTTSEAADEKPVAEPDWVVAWDASSGLGEGPWSARQRYAMMRISSDGNMESLFPAGRLLRTQLSPEELSALVALVAKNPSVQSRPLSKAAVYTAAVTRRPEFDDINKLNVFSEMFAVVHNGELLELDLDLPESAVVMNQLLKLVGLAAIGGSDKLPKLVDVANSELKRKYPDVSAKIDHTQFQFAIVDHPSGNISVWFTIEPGSKDGHVLRIPQVGQPWIEKVDVPREGEPEKVSPYYRDQPVIERPTPVFQQPNPFNKQPRPALERPKPETGAERTLPAADGPPVQPKLADDKYAKSGVPLAEQTWPMPPWGAEKGGLSAGIRIIGDARTGGEVKVELWVRNSGAKDVTFSQCARADVGLSVVAKDKDGKEHSAEITQFRGRPIFSHWLLPPGHIVKVKEFTSKLGSKKNDERERGSVSLDLPPGDYKLRAKWSDSHALVTHAGDWTGELTTGEVDLKIAAADGGADAAKPAAKPLRTAKASGTESNSDPRAQRTKDVQPDAEPVWAVAWDLDYALLNQRHAEMRISSDGKMEALFPAGRLLRTQLSADELSALVALVAKNPHVQSRPMTTAAEYAPTVTRRPELDANNKMNVFSEKVAVVQKGELFELDLELPESAVVRNQLRKFIGLAAIGGSSKLPIYVHTAIMRLKQKYPEVSQWIDQSDFRFATVAYPSSSSRSNTTVWFNFNVDPASKDGQVVLRIPHDGPSSLEKVETPKGELPPDGPEKPTAAATPERPKLETPPGADTSVSSIRIAGKCVDEKGVPVERATIALYSNNNATKSLKAMQTLADGSFDFGEFPDPELVAGSDTSYLVVAHKEGKATGIAAVLAPLRKSDAPDLVLGVPEELKGTVTGPDGLPVANARVRVANYPWIDGVHGTVTNKDGVYVLERVPSLQHPGLVRQAVPDVPGAFDLVARAGQFLLVDHSDFGSLQPMFAACPETIDVRLNKPATITGRVVDENKAPVAGLKVSARPSFAAPHRNAVVRQFMGSGFSQGSATTDSDGRYSISLQHTGAVDIDVIDQRHFAG
jgi:hypothetical protein